MISTTAQSLPPCSDQPLVRLVYECVANGVSAIRITDCLGVDDAAVPVSVNVAGRDIRPGLIDGEIRCCGCDPEPAFRRGDANDDSRVVPNRQPADASTSAVDRARILP